MIILNYLKFLLALLVSNFVFNLTRIKASLKGIRFNCITCQMYKGL